MSAIARAGPSSETPQTIGEWRTLDELVILLRRRAEDLNVTRIGIDQVSGLPSGYAAKVLCPKATGKNMGTKAMELLIAALGMTMIAIEHPEAMRKHASRIEKRKIRRHAGTDMPALKRKKPSGFLHFKGNSEAARRLRAAQLIRMSVKERKAAAKRAAEVRWARHRAKLRAVRSLAS